MSLSRFLALRVFARFDVVLQYDRGKGIRAAKGGDHFHRFLEGIDTFHGTTLAGMLPKGTDKLAALDSRNLLPREPKRALELIDRFLIGARGRTKTVGGKRVAAPLKVAVMLDYAHFIAPQGEPLYLADLSQTLIQILDWGSDPAISGSVATVLITENLADLNRALVESPYSAKIRVTLPTSAEILAFVLDVTRDVEAFDQVCEVSREALAEKLVGLSRVKVRALLIARPHGRRADHRRLPDPAEEGADREGGGGPARVHRVLAHPRRRRRPRRGQGLAAPGRGAAPPGEHAGDPHGLPARGRIGTGKTYLVECLAGEIGIPCVELKNFREKWVGATEGNLEKVFTILHALGQVIVFVDEADQMTGKRGGWRRRLGPLGPGLRHARQGDVRHREPRQDHLDLRHLPARPARGRPQAPGPARRPHPAVSRPATPRAGRRCSPPWRAS